MTQPIRTLVDAELEHARSIRHELHRIPELGFKEERTSRVVQRELASAGVQFTPGLAGGTGVLGYIPATRDADRAPTIALRADMDALPIEEKTGRPYASESPGLMHACGHDGHTTMLITAARVLARLPDRPNNILLLFQPAEEGGAGGKRMCEEGVVSGQVLGKPADAIYGLHGWPFLPLGQVSTRTGPLLAATDEFMVTIHGSGGHAAYPHLCVDPIVVAAHIVTALQTIASRRTDPLDALVVTVGVIQAGCANNVIPDSAAMRGTVRTLKDSTRAQAARDFKRLVEQTAAAHGARAEIDWQVGYPATVNHPEPTDRLRRLATAALGKDRYVEAPVPSMGGEDFSFYGKIVPACFFLLGLCPPGQNYPRLHTPEFDFNDDALASGIEIMCTLAAAPK